VRTPVASLDPLAPGHVSSLAILSNVYDSLVELDRGTRLVPRLAVAWTNPSENTWRFTLRGGVHFHDGRPFTAADVKYTLDRGLRMPESWLRSRVPLLERVTVIDPHTVEVATRGHALLLLNQLAEILILPSGADPNREGRAVGTGPYRQLEWSPEGGLVLEGGGRHWSGLQPSWSRVSFEPEPDGDRRVQRVLDGEADLADFPSLADLARIREDPATQVLEHESWRLQVLGFQVGGAADNPFGHKGVRRAVALAVDRRALVERAMAGHARLATQLAPPGIFGFVPELAAEAPDPAAARSALAATPWSAGFATTLYFTQRDQAVADFVAGAVATLGIRLGKRELPPQDLDQVMSARRAPMFISMVSFPEGDAGAILVMGLHTPTGQGLRGVLNFSGYSNPVLDRILDASLREPDPRQRLQRLREAMEIAMSSHVWIPLCIPTNLYAARQGLSWTGNPTGRIRLDEIAEAAR